MSDQGIEHTKLVRQFRQILLWPLQLAPISAGTQIQKHWELLEKGGADNPWGEVRDEFSCAPGEFQPRHYCEFVTFLPYVRRFLYGDAMGATSSGVIESPIRVFRRNDVRKVRMTFPGRADTECFDVVHVDLCFSMTLMSPSWWSRLRRRTSSCARRRTRCIDSVARIPPIGRQTDTAGIASSAPSG